MEIITSRRHRFLVLAGCVMVAITISAVALIWVGPLISGALFLSRPTGKPPVPHDLPQSHEPRHKGYVDFSTGLYVREDEDLVLRHTPPFIVTRTYLSVDRVSRQFGRGTTDNAEWYLIGDQANFLWAELILANGGRIHFDQISPGSSFQNALFVHRSTPTEFYTSRLGWAGLEWVLRFQDGGIARFKGCSTNTTGLCSLTELRDQDGHILIFNRDRTGRLLAVEAPTGRIVFEYDDQNRIVRAKEDAGHRLACSYESSGCLERVVDIDGTARSYTYNARDEMQTISEPGRFIENTWDEGGHVTRQVTRVSGSPSDGSQPGIYVIEFAYRVVHGSVIETNVKGYDGNHTLYQFDAHRYVTEEIQNPEGETPVYISYDRDPVGNFSTAVKVWCAVNGRRATGTAQVRGDDELTK